MPTLLPSVGPGTPGYKADAARVRVRQGDLAAAGIAGSPLDELLTNLARFSLNPLGFVLWAFPWGEPGSSLEDEEGPEPWQREQLDRIGQRLRDGTEDLSGIFKGLPIEEDISSGHGVGKSAQVSWLILWAVSTHEDTRGVVTANTDTQLRTKTWAELSKWYSLFIGKELFTFTATAIYIANDAVREKAWRIDAVPWSSNNTEAFAGLHNKGKRLLVVFDEASTIDDPVWDVTRGATTDTDTQIIWCRYGNPTRTSGEFHKQCTTPKRNHYSRVDARDVKLANKGQIAAWIDDYGDDSDFVRVRVKGMFPRAGYANFISPGLVTDARRRRVPMATYQTYQKILAVDPARFGDDFSVITLRQGLKVHWQVSMSGFDGPDLAGRVFEFLRGDPDRPRHERHDASGAACVVYDAIGNGADFDSALRRIPNLTTALIPTMWGQPAKDDKHYFNQRSEAWGKMRDFLEHGEIPDDDDLSDQLTSLDYGYDGAFRIQLQSKKDMKKNGGKSPDKADSLALSFIPELIDRKMVTAKAKPVKRRQVVWTR
jgi:hypothetical protein